MNGRTHSMTTNSGHVTARFTKAEGTQQIGFWYGGNRRLIKKGAPGKLTAVVYGIAQVVF